MPIRAECAELSTVIDLYRAEGLRPLLSTKGL